jgi:hypothetical protein
MHVFVVCPGGSRRSLWWLGIGDKFPRAEDLLLTIEPECNVFKQHPCDSIRPSQRDRMPRGCEKTVNQLELVDASVEALQFAFQAGDGGQRRSVRGVDFDDGAGLVETILTARNRSVDGQARPSRVAEAGSRRSRRRHDRWRRLRAVARA